MPSLPAIPRPSRRLVLSLACALAIPLLTSCTSNNSKPTPAPPRYAYIINFNSTIWTMAEDTTAGALTLGGNQVNAGEAAYSMVMDASKTYLYVANNGQTGFAPTVEVFSLTGADHRPAAVGLPVASGPGAGVLALSPAGDYLYVGGDTGIFTYRVGAGGALTQVGSPVVSGRTVTGLAVAGHFLYAASGYTNAAPAGSDDLLRVHALDPATGVPSAPVASYATGADPVAVQVHPSGSAVYVMNLMGASLSQYTRNATDGTLVAQTPLPCGTSPYPMGLTLDPTGRFVYVASFNTSGVTGFKVNGDGTLSALAGGLVGANDQPQALAVDPDGIFLYTANYNDTLTAFHIDGAGGLTYVGKSPMGGDGHAILFR